MGPEELGSVYESLLELVPQVTEEGGAFAFATGAETKGNARKTSGSYYTPDSLVQVLLDSALEPVVEATLAAQPGDAVEALLGLSVVDPPAARATSSWRPPGASPARSRASRPRGRPPRPSTGTPCGRSWAAASTVST
ncbi:MAG: hypothetical protein IPP07_28460 [Holophagales bacterium]|nr:hypothetical protein [Holophagales bacterium]